MQSRLEELEFNYETLRFMKDSGTSDKQTREVLVTETNLDSNLVTLLLSLKSTFFRAVLLRYKLCAEKKVSQEGVEANLGNFRFKFRLVTDHLFSSETKEVPVELEEMEEEVEEGVVENKVELAEEEVDEVVEAEEVEENVFARFVKARVKKTGNKKDKVKSSQFYTTFREWYEEHFEEEGVPSKKELKAFLNDNLGASTKNVWNGVSLD